MTSAAFLGPWANAVKANRCRPAPAAARPQLVARAADGDAFVERKNALHLELPENGQPVVCDRGADARNDSVVRGSARPPYFRTERFEVMFICTSSVLISRSCARGWAAAATSRLCE